MTQVNCPQCGALNPAGTVRCARCQADLSAGRIPRANKTPAPQKSGWKTIMEWLAKPVEIDPGRFFKRRRSTQRPDTRVLPVPITSGHLQQRPQSPSPGEMQNRPQAPLQRTTAEFVHPHAGQPAPTTIGPNAAYTADQLQALPAGAVLNYSDHRAQYRYLITSIAPLTHSRYYHAVDLACRSCQQVANPAMVSANLLCPQCRSTLQPVLIHEHTTGRPFGIAPRIPELLNFSQECPGVLRHQVIMVLNQTVYAVVDHPGRWGVVVRGKQQWSLDQSLAAVMQIGRLIEALHQRGFAFSEQGFVLRESLINVGSATELFLADLGVCEVLATDATQAHHQRTSDVNFLIELLIYLLTGREASASRLFALPEFLSPIIQHARRGEYSAVGDLLRDFERLPATSAPDRTLKPMHGQRSDPGRHHTINEDTIVTFTFDKEQDRKTVPIAFYLIADGMGGHDAGDVASRTVYEVVTSTILQMKVLPDIHKSTRKFGTDVSGELLKQAIQEANIKLQQQAEARGNTMGSTVTAVLLIGQLATVANVGDSRTYLLRRGQLEQVTQDHSVVARLVDARAITPEQARQHPQRNRIYRSLGQKTELVVDTFTVPMERGDRLILCCDGLWSMVEDSEIKRLVEQARTPQDACDTLVAAANRAGGEDNISVIVVEMV
ncbi:MAG: protein phosphatase 2C domain-containing protein [Anaerolineae bacterium]|nr:protein phosphatase 2C domain-containing protein [Anaerolineae bacterium]